MSAAPVEPLPGGRCPLCGARNRDDAQWCVQCLTRFGSPESPEAPVPSSPAGTGTAADDGRGSRRGSPVPAADEDPAGVLPRPRRDRDDSTPDDEDAGAPTGRTEQVNRLMAQLAAHEAQRQWGRRGAARVGLAGRPAVAAAIGAAAVVVVLLVVMWVLGHFV